MHHTLCLVPGASCIGDCALCTVRCTLRIVHCAQYFLSHSLFRNSNFRFCNSHLSLQVMPRTMSIVQCALCTMPCVPCSMTDTKAHLRSSSTASSRRRALKAFTDDTDIIQPEVADEVIISCSDAQQIAGCVHKGRCVLCIVGVVAALQACIKPAVQQVGVSHRN